MKLTTKLKGWLEKNRDVEAESSDDVFLKAATEAILDGSLTPDLQKELTADEDASKAVSLENLIKESIQISKQNAEDIKAMKDGHHIVAGEKGGLKDSVKEMPAGVKDVLGKGGGSDPSNIRVKGAHERYDNTKTAAVYPETTRGGVKHSKAGRPVRVDGLIAEGSKAVSGHERDLNVPTDLDKACNGVWFKFATLAAMNKDPFSMFTEHERDLFEYVKSEREFGGAIGGTGVDTGAKACFKVPTMLNELHQKNVVDDAISGGLEAAPIAFDDAVITFPLLHGEVFPEVNVVNVDRGRRIEGVTIDNVTMTWGDGREEETQDNILHFSDGFPSSRFGHTYITEST